MYRPFVRNACAAAVLLATLLSAHAQIKLDAPIPVGPQVKVGTLPNGLTYYIQKNVKPLKKAELRLVVKAGSILEDDDQQGLAHFVEHMAFNGSTNFKKHELVSYLQSIGVKFGADLNAYTSFDETVYILPIPVDHMENLDKGLLVLQDWAGGLTLNPADIDKERDIVLEELRLGKGANDRMNKQLYPKIFNGSLYAQRLPIGKEDIIKGFQPEVLARFYKDWYRPDLMAVVVVGDIDPVQAEAMVKAHFSGLKNPAGARPRVNAPIPVRAATEALVITDKEAGSNALLMRYAVQPASLEINFRQYREKLVDSLFGGMLGQRLQELSQLAAPPFIGGASGVGKLTPRYKSYNAYAALGKGGAAPAISALVEENARARKFGFSAAELARAKKNMMRNYERAYAERDKTDSSGYVDEYMRNFLEKESIPGIENEFAYVKELVPGITLAEMNAYARATIPAADSAKLVVYMGSSKADTPAPTGAQMLASVAAAEKTVVTARDDKQLAASLMETPPKAGSIVLETTDQALGTTLLTLSNGVKVILKPTEFKNDQVLMSAQRFGGQMLFGDKDTFNARYASNIVATMGVKDYTPIDMQKILAGKTAGVRFSLGNYTDNISGSAGSNDIDTLLQLTWLQFAGVRSDKDLYQSFIGKQVESARNTMAQPESVFRDAVLTSLYGKHPRVARTIRPEDFEQVSLERTTAIYHERFGSAKDLTFIFTGSFSVDAIKPLLATYLASLPTTDIVVAYRDVGVRPVTGVVKSEVRVGSEAKSNVAINFTGDAVYSEEAELRFQAMIEVMNLRINDVLREKLGLIYGGGMNGGISRIPYGSYTIGVSLPTGPDKVDKVIAAAFAEIARLKDSGPDAAELAKVKENWMQSHQKALNENGYWLGRLQGAQLMSTDPHSILRYDEQVKAITAADVQAAAKRYFNLENYVQVVLYPEK
jgi:zinc protease